MKWMNAKRKSMGSSGRAADSCRKSAENLAGASIERILSGLIASSSISGHVIQFVCLYGVFIMQEEGYSGIFYVMLILGIIGVLGFFVVAAGAAGGM
jgi:hypothetical protein